MGDITAMPPGFRFYPTEEELVSFYLARKLDGSAAQTDHLNWTIHRVIPELDIYQFNPWDLPDIAVSLLPQQDMEWFFFVPRQESEARGGRPRRLAESGYWKATGSPGNVFSSLTNRPIGEKRTMVFYLGRAPAGRKTEWKMNEYKAFHGDPPLLRQEFSLCRVYKKSKFVRSFDRRPLALPGVSLPQPQDNPRATTGALAQSSQTGTTTKDHVQNLSQIGEGSNSRSMDVEDEISFDLEDFFRAMK